MQMRPKGCFLRRGWRMSKSYVNKMLDDFGIILVCVKSCCGELSGVVDLLVFETY